MSRGPTRAVLLIQRTEITWTKRSRGGPLAQVRARIPTRSAMPRPSPTSAWSFHRISHREGYDHPPFGPPSERLDEAESIPATGLILHTDGLRLAIAGEDIEVRNNASRSPLRPIEGRPTRPGFADALILRVSSGTWSGWVDNERHVGWEDGWWYSETHWCIAWLPRHDPFVFTAREPKRWLDYRVQLR